MTPGTDAISWLPALFTVGGAIVSVTSAFVASKYRVQNVARNENALRKEFDGFRQEIREELETIRAEMDAKADSSIARLTAAAEQIAVLSQEVRLVNRMTEKTLDSLVRGQEVHSKEIAELVGSQSLMTEFLKAKGILA